MKNAGMAGAVALVGIGLITIGLDRPRSLAGIVASSPKATGSGCEVALFEPIARAFGGSCAAWAEGSDINCERMMSADVFGDGDACFVELDGCSTTKPIYILSPDGLFFTWVQYDAVDWSELLLPGESYRDAFSFHLMDVDHDARLDLIVRLRVESASGGFTRRFAWLRNNYDAPARLPADLDNDGDVDGADLGELFSQWTG